MDQLNHFPRSPQRCWQVYIIERHSKDLGIKLEGRGVNPLYQFYGFPRRVHKGVTSFILVLNSNHYITFLSVLYNLLPELDEPLHPCVEGHAGWRTPSTPDSKVHILYIHVHSKVEELS